MPHGGQKVYKRKFILYKPTVFMLFLTLFIIIQKMRTHYFIIKYKLEGKK